MPSHGRGTSETKRGGQASGTRNRDEGGRRREGARSGKRRRRNDQGQYVERMTEAEILDLFEVVPGPVIATTDVAEHFESTTEGARRKLNDLCDAGVLDRRKVGGTRVYWRTDHGGPDVTQ